jgi:hypothetical protein
MSLFGLASEDMRVKAKGLNGGHKHIRDAHHCLDYTDCLGGGGSGGETKLAACGGAGYTPGGGAGYSPGGGAGYAPGGGAGYAPGGGAGYAPGGGAGYAPGGGAGYAPGGGAGYAPGGGAGDPAGGGGCPAGRAGGAGSFFISLSAVGALVGVWLSFAAATTRTPQTMAHIQPTKNMAVIN